MDKKIVITSCSLNTPQEDVWSLCKDDRALIHAICNYRKEIEKEVKEVFTRKKNIIAAEDGYYFAFYESEVEKIKEKYIEPFVGEDGRKKVGIIDSNGNEVMEDVAKMVAATFVPNPENYQYVKFKDNNPLNCNAENLYWSETE